ncbi:MAG: ribonuclease HII [Bifidobacteriaceae bacterium]|jgi:ribonuclease HII|nr:ribonuclease HII [Bifidobacteriaceae bacterium]
MLVRPTLEAESALLATGYETVGGMDEVGRGALAGPVCVGVVVVDSQTPLAPPGLADSKLLSPAQRLNLIPALTRWAADHSIGWASAEEIDRHGIVAALRLAGHRALDQLLRTPSVIVLDGKHNWLSPPPDLFSEPSQPAWLVRMKVKADRECASVAAASIFAKVARDQRMVELAVEFPEYGWQANKGYGSPAHLEALSHFGPVHLHRQSWSLPSAEKPDVRS